MIVFDGFELLWWLFVITSLVALAIAVTVVVRRGRRMSGDPALTGRSAAPQDDAAIKDRSVAKLFVVRLRTEKRCVSVSIAVAEQLGDAALLRWVMPHVHGPRSVGELRAAIATAKAAGLEVLPPPCKEVDKQGYCLGHITHNGPIYVDPAHIHVGRER